MRNRAKCKLCSDIIESYHPTDYVMCKCGHISVDGGQALRCSAMDWNNFIRVDDEGNEILVTVKDKSKYDIADEEECPQDTQPRLCKKSTLLLLDNLIEGMEKLPNEAMLMPVTHYDYLSLLRFLSSLIKADLPLDDARKPLS